MSRVENIKCAECGNDGSKGGLYLTLDARFDPASQTWELQRREDDGGDELDCINCDHRTPVHDLDVFPYDMTVPA